VKPEKLRAHLQDLAARHGLPRTHARYLRWLKKIGFEPKVIYDIGASVLHWTTTVEAIWPDAEVILFDAFEPAAFLYERHRHWIGVLSDQEGRQVDFYQNEHSPAGNSYYRELPCAKGDLFPVGTQIARLARTLDAVVRERGYPLPDLVKIDVQGAERDVIAGGAATLAAAQRLIVEMQQEIRNEGAPTASDTLPWIEAQGWHCDAPMFSTASGGEDGDFGFVRLERVAPGVPMQYRG
jgi:FkbM family methyltransferase